MSENNQDYFIERRRTPRFAVHYIAKVYLNDAMLCGTIIDISQGGVGILLPKILKIGEILSLNIKSVLDTDTFTVKFKAKLVWMNDKESFEGMFRGGLEIEEISEEDRDKLKDHIHSLDESSNP